jgi:hypothetical protein
VNTHPQAAPVPAPRSGRIFQKLIDAKQRILRMPPGNALSFLRQWVPAGHRFRVHSNSRSGEWRNHVFDDLADVHAWVNENADRSLYFTPCVLRREPANGKATKDDVGTVLALHAEIDPPNDINASENPDEWEVARQKILRDLEQFEPTPSVIIDSGGGYQAWWLLAEPFQVDGDRRRIAEIEDRNRSLADRLGADDCWNVDRIMRLPFTTNVPSPTKAARGRVDAPTRLVKWERSLTYDLSEFERKPADVKVDVEVAEVDFQNLPEVALPADLRTDVRKLIADGAPAGSDRSAVRFGVVCELLRHGLDEPQAAAVMLNPAHGIHRAYHEDKDGSERSEREAHRKFGVDLRNAMAKPDVQAARSATVTGYAARAKQRMAAKATKATNTATEQTTPAEVPPELAWLPDANRASLWTYPSGEIVDRKPRPQLLKGLIYVGEIVFVYGKSNSGKSLAILDLGCAVALGESKWAGHKIRNGGPVVYVAGEGRASVEQRLHARARQRVGSGREKGELDRLRGKLSIFGRAVNLLVTADVDAFITDLAAMPKPPCMVILDTYSRCVPGADQSATDNATAAIASMDRIRDAIGCAVVSIHHTNKGGEEFLGSIVLLNNADAMLKVEGKNGFVEITCDKLRDRAKDRRPIELQIHGVTLGIDEDGDTITSACVTFREPKPGTLGTMERKMLQALVGAPALCSANLWATRAGYKDATGRPGQRQRELVTSGYVFEQSENGRTSVYTLTAKGEQAAKGDA